VRALRLLSVTVLAAVLVHLAAVHAQPQPMPLPAAGPALERKALDEILYKTLRDVINTGADLYNSGDTSGCYRMWEGALMTVSPLLDHHPTLQKAIAEGLVNARRTPMLDQRAFVLREVLDKVRATLRTSGGGTAVNPMNPNVTPPPAGKTLWAHLGGTPGVAKIVDQTLRASADDPEVDFFRGQKDNPEKFREVKARMIEYISSLTGGPLEYHGKTMKDAHQGLDIDKKRYHGFMRHLIEALKANNVKAEDAAALLKILRPDEKDIIDAKASSSSIWYRLGSEKGVTKIVDDFIDLVSKDDRIKFYRDPLKEPTLGEVEVLKRKLIDLISSETGGPFPYTARSLAETYKSQGITDEEYTALKDDFKTALEKNNVPADDVTALLVKVDAARKEVVGTAPAEGRPPEPPRPAPEAALRGKVLLDGQPLTAGVVLFVNKDKVAFKAPIGPDGTFVFKGVPVGSYRVAVTDPEKVWKVKPLVKFTVPETSGLVLDVKGDADVNIDLVSK
jgi:truncated hemoglobin YjbI